MLGDQGPEQAARRLFAVKESFALPDGELEFQVAYGPEGKRKFTELRSSLAPMGFRPELSKAGDDYVLTLRKAATTSDRLPRLPVLFALLVVVSLVVSGLLQQEVYQTLVPSWPYYVTFLAFGAAIAILLLAHELGQRAFARTRDAGRANSYLIPGIPFIPPYIPSLGFAISQREGAVNRDSLFDTVVAGPLAMLVIAIVLFAVGDLTAVQSAVPFAATNLGNTTVPINPNSIQLALGSLLGPYTHPIASGYVPVSPIEDGSVIGFIIVFLSLLPMASYDGGFLATIAWGPRAAKVASYLSIVALLVLDTWTYWAIAVIALLLVGRPYQLRVLDEVSPLSAKRKWLLVGTIVVAFLCLPIPNNIATLHLG